MRKFLFISALFFSTLTAWFGVHQARCESKPASGLETIWVSKNDGSVSCEKKSGVSLSEMAKELQSKGVKILNQQKIFDKRMRIAMCGVNKGTSNGYEIPKAQKDAATGAGFIEGSAP